MKIFTTRKINKALDKALNELKLGFAINIVIRASLRKHLGLRKYNGKPVRWAKLANI